jgi:hypothetical protein
MAPGTPPPPGTGIARSRPPGTEAEALAIPEAIETGTIVPVGRARLDELDTCTPHADGLETLTRRRAEWLSPSWRPTSHATRLDRLPGLAVGSSAAIGLIPSACPPMH